MWRYLFLECILMQSYATNALCSCVMEHLTTMLDCQSSNVTCWLSVNIDCWVSLLSPAAATYCHRELRLLYHMIGLMKIEVKIFTSISFTNSIKYRQEERVAVFLSILLYSPHLLFNSCTRNPSLLSLSLVNLGLALLIKIIHAAGQLYITV